MATAEHSVGLTGLSDEQREAALAPDGPLLIAAGPGTGKTATVAARIAHLVASGRVAPTAVLALTFTTAAARTLARRLAAGLGPAGAAVHVATFHAFGLRVVRRWRRELGYGAAEPAVCGTGQARALLLEALGRAAVESPPREALPALGAAVEEARLALAQGLPALAGVATAYERLLRQHGAVDFPGMLAGPLRLFREHPAALRRLQETYRCILADEFQDVSAAQYALLRLLAAGHGNLTVVGDACQTLYGWRGADARFLLGFVDAYPGARVVALTENFRSTDAILAVANTFAAALPYGRQLWTANPPGLAPLLHAARDSADEAAFVATEIARLLAAGALAGAHEVAVLARTNQQLGPIRAALHERNLPYEGAGARGAGVRVGTIHLAKGDEWRAIFIVGVEEDLLPHRRAAGTEAAGTPVGGLPLAGELHAAYVAVTRPRERLYLTHCRRRETPAPGGGDRSRLCRPSRFLDLLPAGSLTRAV